MPTTTQLRTLIESAATLSEFVETEILERVPWIFGDDQPAYTDWRTRVAAQLGLAPPSVYMVGSAAVGYSLSPLKPARDFRHIGTAKGYPSDIDLAVVDTALFDASWRVLVQGDRLHRLAFPPSTNVSFMDQLSRMRLNIYWGSVSHSVIPRGAPVAARLRLFLSATTRSAPLVGHSPKARVYRTREDLVAYHEQSLRQLIRVLP